MRISKWTTILAAVCGSALLFTGCGQENAEKPAKPETAAKNQLVMATNAEFPPYEYIDADGKFAGMDIDIMNAVCRELGCTLKVENMKFDSVIPSVNAGKADIGVAGMSVTEDRKKNVDFTQTYATACQVIIVQANSPIKDADGLVGRKVGVQQGTTGDTLACDIKDVKLQRFTKGAEAVLALIQNKIDAVIIDNQPAKKFVQANEGKVIVLEKPLSDEAYAMAVKKGNTKLLDKVNAALDALKKSGELDAIASKYLAQ
ncbi:MAG: basic amino acid ABC transporter substrate-binding protein [Victivallales bacterium]|nr:basic amino acid ABC transporter substrate-binding protein [Victivallales bacterium]